MAGNASLADSARDGVRESVRQRKQLGDRSPEPSDRTDESVKGMEQESDDRQATPSLIDVASSGRRPLLARKSKIVAYTGRPISSNTSRTRPALFYPQAHKAEHERCATIVNRYPTTNFRDVEPTQPHLPPKDAAARGLVL